MMRLVLGDKRFVYNVIDGSSNASLREDEKDGKRDFKLN